MNTNRGLNFKLYKGLVNNLIEGNTEEYTRAEYKEKIIESLCNVLEKNFIGGHFYKENIKLDYHNT